MLRPRSIGLLLAFITLLVFLPATSNQFINFDDPQYVTENSFVNQGLSWSGVKWAFAGAHESNWHPLTWMSHMLDCDLFRLNPGGPHLVNILFHAANAALLFALVFRLTKNLWPSAFVAALFAWHPLHVESVAWVAERKDVLSTFFTLLTLLSYVQYVNDVRRMTHDPSAVVPPSKHRALCFYWLALLFFVLALLSKPMPVTLPLVMLLLDYWPLERFQIPDSRFQIVRRTLLEKIPFCLFSAMVCAITILAQHHAESSLDNVPLSLRLENSVTAYILYLAKMIWPGQLAIFYPLHAVIERSLIVKSVLILASISVLAWLGRKHHPWLLVGWLWYLITLLPVIGLVQVGAQSMADRYSYFPLIGIFLVISFSLQSLVENFLFFKKTLVLASVLVLVICVSLTERQLSYWHDGQSLFSHALEVEESDIAHINLGKELKDENQMVAAMNQYIMAWRINPESVLVNVDIGEILAEQGKPEVAAIYYQRAVKANGWLPSAAENYGRVLVTLKRYDEAMKEFALAAQIEPSRSRSHFLMAKLWLLQGQDVTAAKELRTALQLEPDNLDLLTLTASVLASSENPQARNGAEALVYARRAVELTHGQQAAAYDVLAMSRAEIGQFGQAVLFQQQAIQLAEAGNQQAEVGLLQKRMELYLKHQPWRESFKKD